MKIETPRLRLDDDGGFWSDRSHNPWVCGEVLGKLFDVPTDAAIQLVLSCRPREESVPIQLQYGPIWRWIEAILARDGQARVVCEEAECAILAGDCPIPGDYYLSCYHWE